ncbi:MAG: TraG/TraD/VirD4 family protein, partial [Actinomycetota bacterium]|nr:TraG/TraD/VirD4 family protein [Actinomycetota bacterium]
ANIAPIHDLDTMVSQAGGQGLHVIAAFQDLSQVRAKWSEELANGFLTLFSGKFLFGGITDPRTTEALSLALDEYDRRMQTDSFNQANHPLQGGRSTSFSYQRQRVLTPGQITNIPDDMGVFIYRGTHTDVRLTPVHAWPWKEIIDRIPDTPPPETLRAVETG